MTEMPTFDSPSERWLAEHLARCTDLYRTSRAYRLALNQERAPMFRFNHPPLCAA